MASAKLDIGLKAGNLVDQAAMAPVTAVEVVVNETTFYTAGDPSAGRTVSIDTPWGTQAMANNLLAALKTKQAYQPFEADGVLIHPAVELGDGVQVKNTYGGIYSARIKFGRLWAADLSAPGAKDIESEIPFKSKGDRKIERKFAGVQSQLKVQAQEISARVTQTVYDAKMQSLDSQLSVQAEAITAKVTKTDYDNDMETLTGELSVQAEAITAKVSKTGGDNSSFGWDLKDESWSVFAGGATVLKATKDGLLINGKLSTNGATWDNPVYSGMYVGPEGMRYGRNFSVSNTGQLNCTDGTFSGTVYAGGIDYGGNAGYFDGGGLWDESVYDGKIGSSTLSAGSMDWAVNYGLDGGCVAADEFSYENGWFYCAALMLGELYTNELIVNGYGFVPYEITDRSGRQITVLAWV